MRAGFGLVALLVVMAIVLLLSTRQTRRSLDTTALRVTLSAGDAAPTAWDERAAAALLDRLTRLLDEPRPRREELSGAAATAAGWVAGAPAGSREHHAAVKLRSAADELALAAAAADDPHRAAARRHLDDAAATLAGAAPREVAPVRAIRDQIENLQRSRSEQARELQQ